MAASQEECQEVLDRLAAMDEESVVTVVTSLLEARPETAPAIVSFAVPDLTFPPARALTERRANGTIKSFNEHKGFGFIECEDISKIFGGDVFLHYSQMVPGGQQGMPVSFAVMLNGEQKPQAYDVQVNAPNGGAKGGKGKSSHGGGWKGDGKKGDGKKGDGKSSYGGGKDSGKASWGAAAEYGAWGAFAASTPAAPSRMLRPSMPASAAKGQGKKGNVGGWKGKAKDGAKGGHKGAGKGKAAVEDVETIGDEFVGTIKSFNGNSGYGFIECEDLKAVYGNDVFLHHAQLNGYDVGSVVQFAAFLNESGKPQAKDLSEVGAPARAPARKRARTDAGEKGGGKAPRQSFEDVETIGDEYVGTIKSFNPKSGYGFIDCEDLKAVYGNDVFLHHAQLNGFEIGSVVRFAAFLNESGKPQAKDLSDAGAGAY